jgi:hypothetical protein
LSSWASWSVELSTAPSAALGARLPAREGWTYLVLSVQQAQPFQAPALHPRVQRRLSAILPPKPAASIDYGKK